MPVLETPARKIDTVGHTYSFQVPKSERWYLAFEARVAREKHASNYPKQETLFQNTLCIGTKSILKLDLDGRPLGLGRLRNKPFKGVWQQGVVFSWASPKYDVWTLLVTGGHPDSQFIDPEEEGFDPTQYQWGGTSDIMYARREGDQATYVLDITDRLKSDTHQPPGHTLHIRAVTEPGPNPGDGAVWVRNVEVVTTAPNLQDPPVEEFGAWPPADYQKHIYRPTAKTISFDATMKKGGGLSIQVGQEKFEVYSEFAKPGQPEAHIPGALFPGLNLYAEENVASQLYAQANRFSPLDAIPLEKDAWKLSAPTAHVASFGVRYGIVGEYRLNGVRQYSVERVVDVHEDRRIEVSDRIRNFTAFDLGLRLRHYLTSKHKDATRREVRMNGLEIALGKLRVQTYSQFKYPENPSAYIHLVERDTGKRRAGLGFLARDDVFRVHCEAFIDKEVEYAGSSNPWKNFIDHERCKIGIRDSELCLPGVGDEEGFASEATLRWSIFPTGPDEDYWAFVNRARQTLDANFTIPGSFAFVYPGLPYFAESGAPMSVVAATAFASNRGAALVSAGVPSSYTPNGDLALYGPLGASKLTEGWRDQARALLDRFRATRRAALIYFHAYATSETKSDVKGLYPNDYVAYPNGDVAKYPLAGQPLYVMAPRYHPLGKPRLSPYAAALTENVGGPKQLALKPLLPELLSIAPDGVFWDEMDASTPDVTEDVYQAKYNKNGVAPWDGVSARLDDVSGYAPASKTPHRIAYTPLLCREFVLYTLETFLAGKVVVGNGQPRTETTCKLRIPRVVEAPADRLNVAHLYCPVALGDVEEDNVVSREAVAVQIRERLEKVGLYYFYSNRDRTDPTKDPIDKPMITGLMFPFTPVSLFPGALIGEERIVTSRAGVFVAPEGRKHAGVRIFDEHGDERLIFAGALYTVNHASGSATLRLPVGDTAVLLLEPDDTVEARKYEGYHAERDPFPPYIGYAPESLDDNPRVDPDGDSGRLGG